jgi:hypothetical protein
MFGMVVIASAVPADDPKPAQEKPPVGARIRTVIDEYQTARRKASEALEAAQTPGARQRALAMTPSAQKAADRLGKLALEAADDPAAAVALSWIVSHTSGKKAVQSLEKVVARHARNPLLGEAFPDVVSIDSPRIDVFLEDVRDHNPDRKAQAYANFSLARRRARQAQGAESPDQFQSKLREAIALYDRVAADFADVPVPESDKSLGELAKLDRAALTSQKFERNMGEAVALGSPAPETIGPTTEGTPIRLADFRGRVILLDFWGDW